MEHGGNNNGDEGVQQQQQQQHQGYADEGHHFHQQQMHYFQHMAHTAPYGYPMEQGWGPHGGAPPSMYLPPQYDYRYQYPLQHMEGVPLPPGIPGLGGSTDPLEAVLGPFPCVRLRNLPYDASLEDILVFFQGLVLIDVVVVGQGESFVLFSNPMDFQMALQRNRQTIGRRFVEISGATRSDYYEAVAALHEQESGTKQGAASGVIGSGGTSSGGMQRRSDSGGMLRDDPQYLAESSAAGFWTGGGGEATSVTGMHGLTGSGTGPLDTASFESGMSTPLLSASAPALFTMSTGQPAPSSRGSGGGGGGGGLHAPLQKRTGGGIQVGEHTGFLRMRGLPFSAAKEDIAKFFVGYNPVPESVVLTYRNDGRATGEAYIGFASPDDAKRAMELHRRMMGNRYIELFISNKDEQGRALTRFGNR